MCNILLNVPFTVHICAVCLHVSLSVYRPQCCPNPRWVTRPSLPVWSRPTAPACHVPQLRLCGTWRQITAPKAPQWPRTSHRTKGPRWSSALWPSSQGCWKTCLSNAWCTTKGSSRRSLYPWTLKVSWCRWNHRLHVDLFQRCVSICSGLHLVFCHIWLLYKNTRDC